MGMRRERSVVGYGQVIQTSSRCQSNFILDGASGKEDMKFLISQKSVCSKSKWNYVYSKQSTRASRWVFLRILSPGRQSQTITQLEPKSNWDKAAVGQMIYDNTSSVAPEVVKQLISNLSNKHYPVRKKLLLFFKNGKALITLQM
jgi:penicillin amidase